jgi:hypothetical protein
MAWSDFSGTDRNVNELMQPLLSFANTDITDCQKSEENRTKTNICEEKKPKAKKRKIKSEKIVKKKSKKAVADSITVDNFV